jgi:hypothetical protein
MVGRLSVVGRQDWQAFYGHGSRDQMDIKPQVDYDEFLFAQATDQNDGTPVTVMSLLSRRQSDPRQFAIDLSAMPRAEAEQSLAKVIKGAPEWASSVPEAEEKARVLIALLPARAAGKSGQLDLGSIASVRSRSVRDPRRANRFLLIWAALMALTFLVMHSHGNPAPDNGNAVGTSDPNIHFR